MAWTRQKQENQKYFFNGKCLVTSGAQALLTRAEVFQIVQELQHLAFRLLSDLQKRKKKTYLGHRPIG